MAAQRGTPIAWVTTATATNANPVSAAAAPPLAAHAAADPGSRRDASCPAIAPVTAAAKATARIR